MLLTIDESGNCTIKSCRFNLAHSFKPGAKDDVLFYIVYHGCAEKGVFEDSFGPEKAMLKNHYGLNILEYTVLCRRDEANLLYFLEVCVDRLVHQIGYERDEVVDENLRYPGSWLFEKMRPGGMNMLELAAAKFVFGVINKALFDRFVGYFISRFYREFVTIPMFELDMVVDVRPIGQKINE